MSAIDIEYFKQLKESLNLPELSTFDDFVRELRLSAKLVYWLSKEDSTGKYKTFYIDKIGGKKREINSPAYSLKVVQRWILENILYCIKVSKYSYGFIKGCEQKSPLVQVAERHKYNLYLLKIDMKDFYPSIHRDKVFNVFRNIGYNREVSNYLTNICIHNNQLPQGAVTSAYLANLICRRLDNRIGGYCNKRNIIYTRYADDIALSCDDRDALRKAYIIICRIIEDEGFYVNTEKTRFSGPICHKQVLGITINDNLIKAPKQMKRMVRQRIHRQIATGEYDDISEIRGYIAYISQIESGYIGKLKRYVEKLINSDLAYFPELVEAYNKNKLFSGFPTMECKDLADLTGHKQRIDAEDIISTHQEYLDRQSVICGT